MKPGPELDRLIAEKVMGFRTREVCGKGWRQLYVETHQENFTSFKAEKFRYSTSIEAAWEVVEKMGNVELETWYVGEPKFVSVALMDKSQRKWFKAVGPTAPMAICKAALKAVGVEV